MAQANKQPGFDAGREHLGRVYAQAIFASAEKTGETARVMDELDLLVDEVLVRTPKLAEALSTPRVHVADKENLIDKALGGRASQVLVRGLKVMARHGRLNIV